MINESFKWFISTNHTTYSRRLDLVLSECIGIPRITLGCHTNPQSSTITQIKMTFMSTLIIWSSGCITWRGNRPIFLWNMISMIKMFTWLCLNVLKCRLGGFPYYPPLYIRFNLVYLPVCNPSQSLNYLNSRTLLST